MLLDENSCFLSTVLRTHFKEEYKAVMLLDENSCFLSTVLRTNFKEGYKAVMLLVENSCFLSTVLRTHFKEEYKAVHLAEDSGIGNEQLLQGEQGHQALCWNDGWPGIPAY